MQLVSLQSITLPQRTCISVKKPGSCLGRIIVLQPSVVIFVAAWRPCFVFDKYTRTAMALESGADLVVELPPHLCLQQRRRLRILRRVALLDALGVVSHLCFGSESGNLEGFHLRLIFFQPNQKNTRRYFANI